MTLMMTSCASGTVPALRKNDICYVINPQTDLTKSGLRVYDCLCSNNPINKECK